MCIFALYGTTVDSEMWIKLLRMRTAAESCPCGIQSITMGRSAEPSAGVLFSGAGVIHGVSAAASKFSAGAAIKYKQ